MNKVIVFLVLIFIGANLVAQKLSLTAGYNYNSLYDFNDKTPHYSSKYIGQFGFASSFILGINNHDSKFVNPQFSVSLMQVSSKYELYSGGQGGGSNILGEFSNVQFSFCLMPLSINFSKFFDFNLGFDFNFLVNENNSVKQSSWQIGQNTIDKDIVKYRNKVLIYGLTSGVNFYSHLTDNSKIIYQYVMYLSLTDEYYNVRSFRNQLQVGFCRMF